MSIRRNWLNRYTKFDLVVFSIGFLLYLINRFYLKPYIVITIDPSTHNIFRTIMLNHFNDYLAGLIFVPYANIMFDYFGFSKYRIKTALHTLLIGLVCTFFWEVLAPLVSTRSVADILDSISNVFGCFSYLILYKLLIKTADQ